MDIGFVGVGTMGGPMVRNLLEDGIKVTVHDIQREVVRPLEELGAHWADTPKAVAHASEMVLSSLPGPPEVEAVALGPDGIIEGIKKGSVYVDLSSISPSLARKMYPIFKDKGAQVLDAPVSGGEVGATNRTMIIMIGGDRDAFDRCKPLLDRLGENILYTGPIGNGSVCKLVHNCVAAAAHMAVLEGFTLGVKAGVDPQTLWRAVHGGMFGKASPVDGLGKGLFAGKFDPPTFALKLASKDVSLAVQLAREVQVPVPITSLTEQVFLEAMGRGWGDRDHCATDLIQEERAGVQVRVPDFRPD